MSKQEQDRLLADLLLDERRTKKHLACLVSRTRQIREALEKLQDPQALDAEHYTEILEQVSTVSLITLVSDLETSVHHLRAVQADIKAIENPS